MKFFRSILLSVLLLSLAGFVWASGYTHGVAGKRPVHRLDLKQSVEPVLGLPGGATFTHAGINRTYNDKNGELQTAGANEARIDYNTEECLGALLETESANIWLEAISAWTPSNCTITKDATSWQGVENGAYSVEATADGGFVASAVFQSTNLDHTGSWALRCKTGTLTVYVSIDGGTEWSILNLTTSYSWNSTYKSAANPQLLIYFVSSGDAIEVDLIQLETKKFSSSPIDNTGVTIGADLASDGDCSGGTLTTGAGWAHDAGNNEYDATASDANLTDAGVLTENKLYRLKVIFANDGGGSFTPILGGTSGTAIDTNGTYYQYIIAGGEDLVFDAAGLTGSIQSYEVQEHGTVRLTEEGALTYTLPNSLFDSDFTAIINVMHGASWYDVAAGDCGLLSFDGNAKSGMHLDSGVLNSFDGTTENEYGSAHLADEWVTYFMRATGSNFDVGRVTPNGVFQKQDSWDGAFTEGANLVFGVGLNHPIHIKDAKFYNRALSDAEIEALGTYSTDTDIVFVTTGQTFDGSITVTGSPDIAWFWSDGTTSAIANPAEKDFGSVATRTHRLRVSDWDTLDRIDWPDQDVEFDTAILKTLANLRILNVPTNPIYGDISNLVGLSPTYIDLSSTNVTGDIAALASISSLTYLYLNSSSISKYTQGALPNWDGCNIYIQNLGLTQQEVDDFLCDLNTSSTASTKVLNISGTNAAPSASGLACVTSLDAKGWTVTITSTNKTIYMGSGETYTTLSAAFAAMDSGDELVIRDGTYTGTSNVISTSNHPPAGLSKGYPTTIRAENDGAVYFDGENTRQMVLIYGTVGGHSWLNDWKFKGIQWIRSSANAVLIRNGDDDDFTTGDLASALSANIFFKNCGFHSYGPNAAVALYYLKDVLVEDCWAWGNGRYGFQAYVSDNILFRRCVSRRDAVSLVSSYPTSNFVNYTSHGVEFQNCISVDSDSNNYTNMGSFGSLYIKDVYVGRVSEDTGVRGCVLLNYDASDPGTYPVKLGGIYVEVEPLNTTILHTAIVGSSNGIICKELEDDVDIDHCSVLNAAHDPSGSVNITNAYGERSVAVGGYPNVTNSYAVNNSFLAAQRSVGSTSDYNGAYGNLSNTMSYGTHNVTSDPGIKYPVRIEVGSDYSGVASDSGDIGATILFKYGTDGTFYGDSGYNTLTSDDLWPWPNEGLIRTAFRNDYGTTDETRGFCATGETLTNYIWAYLGNVVPPFGLTVEAGPGAGEATLTWTANTEGDIDHYNVYVGDATNTYNFTGYTVADEHSAGNTTTHVVTGLGADEYYFVVTAVDGDPDESGYSNEVYLDNN